MRRPYEVTMVNLVVATQNVGKLKELQQHLVGLSWDLELMPPELDIEETGTTFLENACLKASQTAQSTGKWALADDSGLSITALNDAPGVYSARYGTSDTDRMTRVLRELGESTEREARFICVMALARPDGEVVCQAEGVCPGVILHERRGTGGFGYDPIFYVPEVGQTFAEMSPEQKRTVSHRGRAFAALLPQMKALSPV
jgi:XTP/dITP diphosphohydrolase